MGRPNKPEKRDRQLNLKLTAQERAKVASRADALGLRPGEFGRRRLLADELVAAAEREPRHLAPLLIAQLSRLGNNLNQIARRLHQFDLKAPANLEALIGEIRELIRKVSADGA